NVYFVGVTADGAHQSVGLLKRSLRSCETRHCVGEDVAAWKSEQVHALSTYQQGVGRIEAAGNTDDELSNPRRLQPLHEPLYLNLVDLPAPLITLSGIRGDIRKAVISPGR